MTADFPAPVRKQIRTRDADQCARCGGGKGLALHPRHPAVRTPAAGVTLCQYCRADVTSFPDIAEVEGWRVPAHREPADVPLMHHHYRMHVTLTDRGTCIIHNRTLTEGADHADQID